MISGKDLDRATRQLWPFVFGIQIVAGYYGAIILAFLVTWNIHGEIGYNLGDFWGVYVIVYAVPMILGAISVAVISLIPFLRNKERGYWNCFRRVYATCVRISWILIIPLSILEIILFLLLI